MPPGRSMWHGRRQTCCARQGMPSAREAVRGWDHGVFIPMMVANPDADIPLAQLSLRADLDPAAHIAIGRYWRRCAMRGC